MKFQFKHPQTNKKLSVKNYPPTLWDARYYLDVWKNTIPNENIKVFGRLAELEKSVCSLYLKYDRNFELYSDEKTDAYITQNNLLTKQHNKLSNMVKQINKDVNKDTGIKITKKQINLIKTLCKSEAKCLQQSRKQTKNKRKTSVQSRKRR